jgi:hypothetical protein
LSLLRQQDNPQENEILYLNFINTCKTKITKSLYKNRLRYFMDFLGVKNYVDLIINKDKKAIENDIKLFLVYLREKRKVTYVSAS